MRKLFILASLATASFSTAAWALGVLAISAVSVTPATFAQPGVLNVTATCVQGAGTVKIWVQETTTSVATKLWTSSGNCGAGAATSGKTVPVAIPNSLAPGTYHVILRQGGAQSAPSAPVVLP